LVGNKNTGGEEDSVKNENVDPKKRYTSPEQVYAVYDALSKIRPMFSVSSAFGNVHGVYTPGKAKISPEHQEHVKKKS
jgi:fructose-bisphosphate aldolase, class II